MSTPRGQSNVALPSNVGTENDAQPKETATHLSGSIIVSRRPGPSSQISQEAFHDELRQRRRQRRLRQHPYRGLTLWQKILVRIGRLWIGRRVLTADALPRAGSAKRVKTAAATSALDAQIDALLPAIDRTNQRLDRLHFLVRDMVDDLREARSSGNAPAARAGEEATA